MASVGDGDPADAADHGESCCYLFRCFCRWRRLCPPNIPCVSPGREYVCVPAGADNDRPTWSILVGCTNSDDAAHNLRLHRFRVNGSGRVLGRSNDLLEHFRTVSPDDGERTVYTSAAEAALAPDRRSLNIVCAHWPAAYGSTSPSILEEVAADRLPTKVFSMDLADDKSLSPLPHLPFSGEPYRAISAHGGLWVPTVRWELVSVGRYTRRILVYRLVEDSCCWTEVTSVDFPYDHTLENTRNYYLNCMPYRENEAACYEGSLLQGYAVIRDRFILLSFRNSSFYCFDCAAGTLTCVAIATDGKGREQTHRYVPIFGRAAVHVQDGDDDDNTIYFIRGTKLLAYNYSPEDGKPLLEPPVEVDTIWPYEYKEGDCFVVHLGGRMLCAVWANLRSEPCGCAARHALITTLCVRGAPDETGGGLVPHGVQILHSTFRRIDMLRSEPHEFDCGDTFCFLQEFPDQGGRFDPIGPSLIIGLDSPQDETSEEISDCCREFLSGEAKHPPCLTVLKNCTMPTTSDFYFICQFGQRSLLYHISTSEGRLIACREKAIEAVLSLDTISGPGVVGIDDSPSWFFAHHGSKLDVIPAHPHCDHYVVDVVKRSYKVHKSKRSKLFFSSVFQTGQYVVALGYTLQDVYILNRNNFQWRRQKTSSSSIDLSHKVKISGFVDLVDDAFMISDADKDECFVFDLKKGEWFGVISHMIWGCNTGLLSGRCIFAEGFIYTCSSDGRLIAFELIHIDTSYRLRSPILLDFSWKKIRGDRRFISFDSICKGKIRDIITICLVWDAATVAGPYTSRRAFAATTVQVMLRETERGTKEPVRADHVDVSLSPIDHKGRILTNYAFAL